MYILCYKRWSVSFIIFLLLNNYLFTKSFNLVFLHKLLWLCNKLLKILLQTTTTIYYLSRVLGVQNLGRDQLGSSHLGSLLQLQSDVRWGCSNLKAWLELGDALSRWLTHQCWQWVTGLSFLQMGLSIGLCGSPHEITSGFLQNEKSKRPRQKLKYHLWLSLGSQILSLLS